MLFFMMAFRFSVLLQLSSCTYVHNYFSENARIKFIPIDADVSGVVMAYFCFIFQFPNLICYGLVDWLIRYPMTAVVTVVFTSCPTRGGQQRNQFILSGGFLFYIDNSMLCVLIRIAAMRRFYREHTTYLM